MNKLFTILGWAWLILVNLFILAIVLYIFSRLDTRSDIIIVSILGQIYTAIRGYAFLQGQAIIRLFLSSEKEFRKIKTLLGDHDEYEEESRAEIETMLNKDIAKGWGNIAFLAIIDIICIFELLTNL
jgi:hypothetical protein